MPTTDPVVIPIKGQDTLTPTIKKATMSLRDMGEKVSQLGMRMTAAFTVPIVLAGKSLLSFGAESSKTLSDLNQQFKDAYASNDPAKLKAAGAAWNALSPSVREAAAAYDNLQAALKPINAEFDKAKATLLTALVPILKELTPTIINVAKGVADAAKQFSLLPQGQQNVIISSVALLAAVGPMVVIFGQVIGTIGTLQLLMPGLAGGIGTVATAMKTFGVASYAALGPVGALILAITALVALVNGGQAQQAWTSLMQLTAMGLRSTGLVNNQQFIQLSQNSGLMAAPAGQGGSGQTIINYQPMMSSANKDEAERFLATLVTGMNRKMGR